MSITSDTIAFLWSGGHQWAARHLTLVTLSLVLCATACGSDVGAGGASTSTNSPVTPTTFVVDPASSTPPMPSTSVATAAPRPTAAMDDLVGPAGRRVHVRCVGHGDKTVVLMAGFGGDSTGWATVESAISASARVCSYDRAGTGTSDPATSTTTFAMQATDLHTLLRTLGEPGPYVVVGHSFGGAEAVTFASMFAHDVTGVVLIDASPTTWPAALCAVPEDGSNAATTLHSVCYTFVPTGNSEHLDVAAAFTEASHIVSLGSMPTTVITATRRELPSDLAASEVDRLNTAWNQGQRAWTALSTTSHLVTVDHTGHHIEIDRPGVVIDEITRLLP